jgi:hypothetical protein
VLAHSSREYGRRGKPRLYSGISNAGILIWPTLWALPKNAQLCLARRLRAKVSWFPLADRVSGPHTLLRIIDANDRLLMIS